jgi:hypothetical protein
VVWRFGVIPEFILATSAFAGTHLQGEWTISGLPVIREEHGVKPTDFDFGLIVRREAGLLRSAYP